MSGTDRRKKDVLGWLDEARARKRKQLADCREPCREQQLLEDELALLNILARAEKDGRSNLADAFHPRPGAAPAPLPPEVHYG